MLPLLNLNCISKFYNSIHLCIWGVHSGNGIWLILDWQFISISFHINSMFDNKYDKIILVELLYIFNWALSYIEWKYSSDFGFIKYNFIKSSLK